MNHQQFLNKFNDACNKWASASSDELYEAFVKENGLKWPCRVAEIVSPDTLQKNRRGFYEFYFNSSISLSARSDPRSGVFVRDQAAEGGKTELLLHLAMGIKGFAELAKVKRVINGSEQRVYLDSDILSLDFGEYEDIRNNLRHLMELPEAVWDDALIKPSFDDALNEAKVALLETAKADCYDSAALHRLLHVVLCGGHCTGGVDCIKESVADKMSEILTITAAIRGAAKELQASLN